MKNKISSTPYDDVFRTLVTELDSALICLVNEMFDMNYTVNKKVTHLNNDINEYTYTVIVYMLKKVVDSYAKNYNKVKQEVLNIMGGKVIEFKARTEYHQGKNEGKNEGRIEGYKSVLNMLVEDGKLTQKEAQKYLNSLSKENSLTSRDNI